MKAVSLTLTLWTVASMASHLLASINQTKVCASLYGYKKSLINASEFHKERSSTGKAWNFVNTGACQEVSECKMYKPLCAISSVGSYKTFFNRCLLEAAQKNAGSWKLAYMGVCSNKFIQNAAHNIAASPTQSHNATETYASYNAIPANIYLAPSSTHSESAKPQYSSIQTSFSLRVPASSYVQPAKSYLANTNNDDISAKSYPSVSDNHGAPKSLAYYDVKPAHSHSAPAYPYSGSAKSHHLSGPLKNFSKYTSVSYGQPTLLHSAHTNNNDNPPKTYSSTSPSYKVPNTYSVQTAQSHSESGKSYFTPGQPYNDHKELQAYKSQKTNSYLASLNNYGATSKSYSPTLQVFENAYSVSTNPHYLPTHMHPASKERQADNSDLPPSYSVPMNNYDKSTKLHSALAESYKAPEIRSSCNVQPAPSYSSPRKTYASTVKSHINSAELHYAPTATKSLNAESHPVSTTYYREHSKSSCVDDPSYELPQAAVMYKSQSRPSNSTTENLYTINSALDLDHRVSRNSGNPLSYDQNSKSAEALPTPHTASYVEFINYPAVSKSNYKTGAASPTPVTRSKQPMQSYPYPMSPANFYANIGKSLYLPAASHIQSVKLYPSAEATKALYNQPAAAYSTQNNNVASESKIYSEDPVSRESQETQTYSAPANTKTETALGSSSYSVPKAYNDPPASSYSAHAALAAYDTQSSKSYSPSAQLTPPYGGALFHGPTFI